MKKIFILIAVTVAISVGLSVVPKAIALSYVPVSAFKVVGSDVTTTVNCNGTFEASVKREVSFVCPVLISKTYVKIGDHVKKGERLFDIDKSATLQNLLNSGVNPETATQATSTSKSQTSTSSGDVSAALKQALSLGVIGNDTYNALIGQAQNQTNSSSNSNVESFDSSNSQGVSEADYEKIVDNIEAKLVAPISGVVTDIDFTDGEITQANVELAEITDFNSIQVMTQIGENDIKTIKKGQIAAITGPGFIGTYQGFVKQIYPTASKDESDTSSENMVNVIIGINHPSGKLLPGLAANVTVNTSLKHGVLVVPFESIMQDDNNTEYVFVFKDGRAVRKNIETGDEYDSGNEVIKGIHAGDIIIENPPDTLKDGSNIKIKY